MEKGRNDEDVWMRERNRGGARGVGRHGSKRRLGDCEME